MNDILTQELAEGEPASLTPEQARILARRAMFRRYGWLTFPLFFVLPCVWAVMLKVSKPGRPPVPWYEQHDAGWLALIAVLLQGWFAVAWAVMWGPWIAGLM